MVMSSRETISARTSDNPFELLKKLKEQMEYLNSKLSQLESKIDERMPEITYSYDATPENGNQTVDFSDDIKKLQEKITSMERKIEEESYDPSALVENITQRMKEIIQKPIIPASSSLTAVEAKRIEKIIHLLERHEKLNSNEMAELLDLSRTRCNEYFKLMERMNLVEPKLMGKEKYYLLKG